VKRERLAATLDGRNSFLNRVNLLGQLARENPTRLAHFAAGFYSLLIIARREAR